MKDRLLKVIRYHRVTIFLLFMLFSIILTSYSFYKDFQNVNAANTKSVTKQELRTFFEDVNEAILPMIDAGQKEIRISISIPKEVDLLNMSKRPDFDKFLSIKQCQCDDIYGVEKYVNQSNDLSWRVGYCLYPKDALIK